MYAARLGTRRLSTGRAGRSRVTDEVWHRRWNPIEKTPWLKLVGRWLQDLINWGLKNSVDIIAPSFVRKGSDVVHIRSVLGAAGAHIQIISKVENNEGLDNYEDIVRESDGIMVARGDLGMEIPRQKIFMAQKRMIHQCNVAGKPVITATQMLESMTQNPRPTRAEATDVANAVLDGTDCVMLSGETAAGPYPVEAVKVMADICHEAESFVEYEELFQKIVKTAPKPMCIVEALASSAVRAQQKTEAKLIIVLSRTGKTVRGGPNTRPVTVFRRLVAHTTPIQGLSVAILNEKRL
jgi:pyruvate kinase